MSEHDANRAMAAAANLRLVDDKRDPNEGEPMSVADRRYRQLEARAMHEKVSLAELAAMRGWVTPRMPDFRDHDPFDRGVAGMHQRAQRDGFPSDDTQ